MAVDRGFFAFIDLKFGEWPTLLLTFPKASPNNGGDVVLIVLSSGADPEPDRRIRMFLGLLDPDPSFIKQK
jgi:hypothetical protein